MEVRNWSRISEREQNEKCKAKEKEGIERG